MGRIFLSAGHGGQENGRVDPGSIAAGTTEAREMILTRDLVVTELRSRGFEVLSVPDELSLEGTIAWINSRVQRSDVALEIHSDAFSNPSVRGTSVFFITNNDQRKGHAELLLLALLRRVPQLPNRGAKPDTTAGIGNLPFCRQIAAPSLLMEIGYLTNPDDRFLIQNRRRDIALGIADGLAAWSRAVSGITTPTPTPSPSPSPSPTPTPPPTGTYATVNIKVNGQVYGEQGIIISGNSYIPIDLADRLGIDLSKAPQVRRVTYRSVVYIKAIELREFSISVTWDNTERAVVLRSILEICINNLDRIMGHGSTSEVQLMMFLKANNESALTQFPDLPKLYLDEAKLEGVNPDIAFCQMCIETGFLRFGNDVKPSQNNFAGLGAIGGGAEGAAFSSARIGVRAQIQHLKAYASTEPLVQELVDPRFRFVTRGIAPRLDLLSGRWAADLEYGPKILAVMRRLYESSGLL
jgi:hypothetical protein